MQSTVCKKCNAEYDPEMGCYCNVIEFPGNVDEVKSARPKPKPEPVGFFPGTAVPMYPAKRATTMRVSPDAHLGAVER